jgi:hypothetical protein
MVENIQACGEYLLRDQRIVVDHLSSGNVHDNGIGWQQLNASTIKKSGEIRSSRSRDQDVPGLACTESPAWSHDKLECQLFASRPSVV